MIKETITQIEARIKNDKSLNDDKKGERENGDHSYGRLCFFDLVGHENLGSLKNLRMGC